LTVFLPPFHPPSFFSLSFFFSFLFFFFVVANREAYWKDREGEPALRQWRERFLFFFFPCFFFFFFSPLSPFGLCSPSAAWRDGGNGGKEIGRVLLLAVVLSPLSFLFLFSFPSHFSDVYRSDAEFFGMDAKEAEMTDPILVYSSSFFFSSPFFFLPFSFPPLIFLLISSPETVLEFRVLAREL